MSSNSNSDSEDERISSSSVKNSFCIEALLARDRVSPIFRNSTESRSSSISPGCEDNSMIEGFCPKPSLMLAAIDSLDYTNSTSSAFQPLLRHNQSASSNKNISPEHIQQMQFEWLSRTGMFYGPRLQELTGKTFNSLFKYNITTCPWERIPSHGGGKILWTPRFILYRLLPCPEFSLCSVLLVPYLTTPHLTSEFNKFV